MGEVVERQQVEAMELSREARARGEIRFAAVAVLLATIVVVVGLILVSAHLGATWSSRRPAALGPREKVVEKVYVGRAGDLGFVLRGTGPNVPGKFLRTSEGRVLGLPPGQLVARMDAFNFSDRPVSLADGELVVQIGEDELRPLPPAGETNPPSPVRAALVGGDVAKPLAGRSARRLGLVGNGEAFDRGSKASVRRGPTEVGVELRATIVTERELAEFDRAPGPVALDRLSREPQR